MSSKDITEQEVEAFLTKLKASETDKKVDQVQFFGLRLEETDSLPESTLDALTLIIPSLLRSNSHLLITSTLSSFLPFYLPHIPTTSNRHVQLIINQILPILLEKLNDPKDRVHTASSTCIVILGNKAYEVDVANGIGTSSVKGKEKEGVSAMWERSVKEVMVSKGSRGKLECLKLLESMRKDGNSKLPLKTWLPVLVDLLEDGDGPVREQARESLITMLSQPGTPAGAKADVKKLLLAKGVRKTISESIINRIFNPSASNSANGDDPEDSPELHTGGGDDGGIKPRSRTPGPDDIPTVYIASAKDLESEFGKMLPFFAGKETEQNWNPREKSVIGIRGMLRGHVTEQFKDAFVAGLRVGILEGVCRIMLSLRTTVSQQACAAIQELGEHLRSSFDPFVESLLPTLGKMSGYTKKITADKSQRALTAIITHTTCHPKTYINHISSGISDKNIQTRYFSAQHLKTFLEVHGQKTKSTTEGTMGLMDVLDGCVRKSLNDVNPGVKENARAAYWIYDSIWPVKAKAIMDSLDGQAKKQLDKVNPKTSATPTAESTPIVAAVVAPVRPIVKKAATSTAALLAERRKAAKADRESSASTFIGSPPPPPPSKASTVPKPVLSTSYSTSQVDKASTSKSSSPEKPSSPSISRKGSAAKPQNGSPTPTSRSNVKSSIPRPGDAMSRSRSSSLARTLSSSPPNKVATSKSTTTPTTGIPSAQSGIRSNTSSSVNTLSSINTLKTPTLNRRPIPSSFTSPNTLHVGMGIYPSPEVARNTAEWIRNGNSPSSSRVTRNRNNSALNDDPAGERENGVNGVDSVVQEAMTNQVNQALSAAEQLLDFDDDQSTPGPSSNGNIPVTPARPNMIAVNGNGNRGDLLRTPMNGLSLNGGSGRNIWEDSPRNVAVTPMFLEKLKGRKYERSWWTRQKQLMDKASPLRQQGSTSASSSISLDLGALKSGRAEVKNLQKLALFASEHPVPQGLSDDVDEEDIQEAKKVWEEDNLFESVFEGLMAILEPSNSNDILEQALVLLWELIEHQWVLFEDKEEPLTDALFRLRACSSHTILESTNSLLSLLSTATDHLLLIGTIQMSLSNYLTSFSSPPAALSSSTPKLTDQIKSSAYLFALNGIGMCILHLPSQVVEIEAKRLEPLVMTSINNEIVSIRQAGNVLMLAVQCILRDSEKTLNLFNGLSKGQKNLVTYLMETNGLLVDGKKISNGVGSKVTEEEREEESEKRKERVLNEMEGLMARGNGGV